MQEKARKLPRGARPGALARGLAARCTRALAGFRGRPPGVGWGRWSTHVGEAVQSSSHLVGRSSDLCHELKLAGVTHHATLEVLCYGLECIGVFLYVGFPAGTS